MGRADRIIQFIECLTITAGPDGGKPFRLREWQKKIIRSIYDPQHPDGRRKVRTAVLSMGRKNGKTELAAALILAHLIGPEAELNGQIYSAAADRYQAALVYQAAANMVRADPVLESKINIIESVKRLVCYDNGSFYAALSSESRSKHGFNPTLVIVDEAAQLRDRRLFDVLQTSQGARAEPLFLVISTLASDPNHVLSELVNYGEQVNDGTITDDTFKAFIFQAPLDADPWDEKNWYLANPALGDFRSLEEMRTSAEQAKRLPAREPSFRNLYLNQPVDAETRFISSVDWNACAEPVDLDALAGRTCFGGLDLGSTQDLTALALIFPDESGGFDALCWFWLPADAIHDRAIRDRVPYDVWTRQGFIETTEGRAINKAWIAQKLAELSSRYDIQGIAYDRWRIEDLKVALADQGIDLPLTPWGQGFKDMGPAVDALETHILRRTLRHGGNPVLTWNCANAVVVTDPAGARKIAKDKSTDRVDGLVALAMGIGLATTVGPPIRSVYQERGILSVNI